MRQPSSIDLCRGSALPLLLLLLLPLSLAFAFTLPAGAAEPQPSAHDHNDVAGALLAAEEPGPATLPTDRRDAGNPADKHLHPCENGEADGYPCSRVDLLERLTYTSIGATGGNDAWGWTDKLDGKEYALIGTTSGTSFVDITDPEDPIYLGRLPTHTTNSAWRDIKVYADHAFIVSEASGHGMQVFDLTQLRDVDTPPVTFSETTHYDQFGDAHNIVINEDSGFAYAVGTNSGAIPCSAGLHMVDISDPLNPTFAGCFSSDGYTHDAQCVTYAGPDADHQGKEICFACNEDTVTVVDVTDKQAPVQLSRNPYAGSGYTHQGWLTDDQKYFLVDDEIDELNFGHNTRTYIWDMSDLDAPSVMSVYTGPVASSDHNLYVHQGHVYEANYRSGLRILSLSDIDNGNLTEVGYFDVIPGSDGPGFSGAWTAFPYFASGTVLVNTIGEGVFLVRPQLCTDPAVPATMSATAGGDNVIDLSWGATAPPNGTYNVYRAFGTCPGSDFQLIATGVTGTTYADDVSGQIEYAYYVTALDESGLCESDASQCASTITTGVCNAPPAFFGVESVTDLGVPTCALEVGWSPATLNCGASATYSVYRSTDPVFTPSPATLVASGITDTSWVDSSVLYLDDYVYVVHATDVDSGAEDDNLTKAFGTPRGPVSDGAWATGAELNDPSPTFETVTSFAAVASGPSDTEAAGGGEPIAHIGWEASDERQRTGDRSYFSTYADGACIAIITPPLDLTVGELSKLSFWTVYEIEERFDGGVVQISADDGESWELLPLDQGYPTTFNNSGDACSFATGHPSISGTDLSWNEFTADLSDWNGQQVKIRWIFSTDGGLTLEGWYIDDVVVTHAQVPGSCFNGLFGDRFESGDTSAWSNSVP